MYDVFLFHSGLIFVCGDILLPLNIFLKGSRGFNVGNYKDCRSWVRW